jgi:hypothetical protein
MQHYFFHVYQDGDSSRDCEGVALADDSAAWDEAIRSCGQMIQDLDGTLRIDSDWRMDVTDADGAVLYRLRFRAEHGPA